MDLSVQSFERHIATVRSKNTAITYRHAVGAFVDYLQEAQIDIHKAPNVLAGFVAWLMLPKHQYNPASVKVYVPGVVKYLEWRRAQGDNLPVFIKPDIPSARPKKVVVLRDAPLRAFREYVEKLPEPIRTGLILLPLCGLRSEEFCALRLSQIEPSRSDPSVLMLTNIAGKSKDTREVPLVAPGSRYLYEYLAGYRRTCRKSPFLFPTTGKSPSTTGHIVSGTLRGHMRQARTVLGLPRCSLHTLRKTWVTALVEQGVPVHTVAELAGHQSIQTTYKHYIGAATQERLVQATKQRRVY